MDTVFAAFMTTADAAPSAACLCAPPAPGRGYHEHGIELTYATGRNQIERVFEAVSAGARWRATPKWEFEARETWNLDDGEGLDTRVLLRRYGHDFIFELELADRAGEGQSFSVGVKPVLGFRRPQIGLIERWLDD